MRMMLPVVAMTLVSEAMSNTVSTVIGSSVGIQRPVAKCFAIDHLSLVPDDDTPLPASAPARSRCSQWRPPVQAVGVSRQVHDELWRTARGSRDLRESRNQAH